MMFFNEFMATTTMINYDDILIQQYSSVINLTIQIPEYDDYYDYKHHG